MDEQTICLYLFETNTICSSAREQISYGSSGGVPVFRIINRQQRASSLVVERPAHNRVVAGSNPSWPIHFQQHFNLRRPLNNGTSPGGLASPVIRSCQYAEDEANGRLRQSFQEHIIPTLIPCPVRSMARTEFSGGKT